MSKLKLKVNPHRGRCEDCWGECETEELKPYKYERSILLCEEDVFERLT